MLIFELNFFNYLMMGLLRYHRGGKVAIIGGGIAGVMSAVELAKAGHQVTIFERGHSILSHTSSRHARRLQQGYHYPLDYNTAAQCLKAAIEFKREFYGCNVSYSTGEWWNVITKESLDHTGRSSDQGSKIDAGSFRHLAHGLREYYRTLVKEDLRNRVFGDPDKFFSVIQGSEVAKWLNVDRAGKCIASCEEVIDVERLVELLKTRINLSSRLYKGEISLKANTLVTAIESVTSGWRITSNDNRSGAEEFDAIINATWSLSNEVNSMAGLGLKNREMTVRLKPMVFAKLPEKLRAIPSTFFLLGSFTNFTNLGNGNIAITYAPESNVASFDGQCVRLRSSSRFFPKLKEGSVADGKMPSEWKDILFGNVSGQDTEGYAKSVLEGGDKFVPGLKEAQLIEVRFGTVISMGKVSIRGEVSDHHMRTGMTPRALAPGFYEMRSPKFAHSVLYARKVASMVNTDLGISTDDKSMRFG